MSCNKKDGLPARPRILIVRLSAIGDVLHATSVVHNLRLFLPHAHISWLVSPPADALLKGNPDIDELIVWDRRPLDRASQGLHLLTMRKLLKKARAQLRQYKFDIVLDIQGLLLTGLLARFTGAPRRIGIHERHEGNPFFMTEMAPNISSPHKIKRYLTALQPLGWQEKDFQPGLVLALSENHSEFARHFWQAHGISPDKRILLVNIRTTWPDKHPQPETFGKALALASLPDDVQFVFPGTREDIPHIEAALQAFREMSASNEKEKSRALKTIAGTTSLMELAQILASATLLLTCDTGTLYLAEAVGLATLSLWGPTLPSIYGPLTPGHHFLISPHSCKACCRTKCKHRTNACMRAIKPAMIAERLNELLPQKH